MTLTFQNELDAAMLRSERKRTLIIIFIFLFALCYRVFEMCYFSNDHDIQRIATFTTVWLFPMLVIVFELFSFLYIHHRIKTGSKKIPIAMQYINMVFEISLPACIMLIIAMQNPGFDVLKSPAANIYFIFIILSTLRLNFLLCFFSGALASCSYWMLSFYVHDHFGSTDAAKAIILLLSGVAAGLVAKQIRSGINHSVMLAEKSQRITHLFGKQISKEVAEKMLEQNGQLESRRMNVAVMFIDIRDFTKFACDKSPEEIVQYQNLFFNKVVTVVSKHGGIVNQFLGDGCMTTFGAPVEIENPSCQAVNAALELLGQIRLDVQVNRMNDTTIGVGIHCGEAVTGNIGNAERQQYSITGNVVIMASRIEQLNKTYQSQLLVSEEVIRETNFVHPSQKLGNIILKGFETPLSIYQLA